MNQQTIDFIKANADGDIRQLAFKRAEGVDLPFALDQISGRQTAIRKLPSWASVDGITYPPHLSMEQCSSEATASYKANLTAELVGTQEATRLVDLTGGFGVDFSFMAKGFKESIYVERQDNLCNIAQENFRLLDLQQAEVVCDDGTKYLQEMPHATLIYIDPARRDAAGARTFAISDCTPNVCELKETMLKKADYVIIKLSPMLDWRKAVADLGREVAEVHIVSVGNECKELLLVMSPQAKGLSKVRCVNDGQTFDFNPQTTTPPCIGNYPTTITAPCYLYEPNASLMKAGCFAELEAAFGITQIAHDSHLYINNVWIDHFPGRTFKVEATTSMNKKELKKTLAHVDKANIAVRNFPMSVAELRRRLKISEGGDTFIFATTLASGSHLLLVCTK